MISSVKKIPWVSRKKRDFSYNDDIHWTAMHVKNKTKHRLHVPIWLSVNISTITCTSLCIATEKNVFFSKTTGESNSKSSEVINIWNTRTVRKRVVFTKHMSPHRACDAYNIQTYTQKTLQTRPTVLLFQRYSDKPYCVKRFWALCVR